MRIRLDEDRLRKQRERIEADVDWMERWCWRLMIPGMLLLMTGVVGVMVAVWVGAVWLIRNT